ncbi:hypothetical protein KAX22_04020, partial [bacterium]|nr:hypothetical protein [bacterium]
KEGKGFKAKALSSKEKEIKTLKSEITQKESKLKENEKKLGEKIEGIKSFDKNLKKKEKEQVVIAAKNYRIETEREKQEKRFIKHPATFLRKNRWKDHLGPPGKEEMEEFDEIQERAMERKK